MLPNQLTMVNKKRVPVYSILLAFVVGLIFFLPFPSWSKLVGVITSATAIMYAFAPVSLAALHRKDPDRPRTYRIGWPAVTLPAGFCMANLIIYWGGFDVMWKLLAMIFVGRVLFEFALRRAEHRPHRHRLACHLVDLALADRAHGDQRARQVRPRAQCAARLDRPRSCSSCSAWASSTTPSSSR